MKNALKTLWNTHRTLCSWLLTVGLLALAYTLCATILHFTRIDNDAPVIYVLAVILISRMTYRVYYGIVASMVSTFAINYFFTFPYNFFTLSIVGYPIDFVCFLAVTLIVSMLTYQLRGETDKAIRHEQETVELYEKNRKLEEERAAAEMAVEKEKMHSNLLRAVSHDLRTPLTAVAGASSMLIKPDSRLSPEEQHKLASDIHEEALWLTQMVENLLSITRVQGDNGAIHLKERAELVEEIVEESVTKVRRRFPNQEIDVRVPDEILLVPMDAMLIEQVLINLMENAVRHSGVKDKIEVAVCRRGDAAAFTVRDHGVGIDEEKLPHLFSGGGSKSDGARGMGIGLSVCRSIIKAHGGTLAARNHPEGGSEFYFELRLEEKNMEEEEHHEYETPGDDR